MFYINKTLERLSRLFRILINKDYFINHKYQNKNQVTNTNTIFTILKNKNYYPQNIFDIGCGHGEWFKKINKIFPKSKYYLFDANYENKEFLRRLSVKHKINYKICLISNKIKKIKFYIMGYGSSVYNELSQHNRKIKIIESTTLKKEINEHNILSKNNLLKLDVQGSELDILKGLKEKINIFEAIILETSVRRLNKSSPLFITIINFMYKNNFIFFDICDLKRLDGKNSTLIQLDALFIRKNSKLLNKNYH